VLLCLFTSFQEKGNISKKTRKIILSGTEAIIFSVYRVHRVLVDYRVAAMDGLLRGLDTSPVAWDVLAIFIDGKSNG